MSYSGEAADQVVRLSLNGVEVAAKLSGSAAKQLAIMIYAILKDQKKTKGKIRLTNGCITTYFIPPTNGSKAVQRYRLGGFPVICVSSAWAHSTAAAWPFLSCCWDF